METQARNMYAFVCSESVHVMVMPAVPSGHGKVERTAEAIVVIVSSSE